MPPILIVIATVLIPPLGVFLKVGIGVHFWINLLLTLFLPYVGGLIHGIWVLVTK